MPSLWEQLSSSTSKSWRDPCGSWLAGDGLRRSPKGLSPSCSPPPGPMRFLWELACRRWAAPQPQGPQPKLFASARINAIPVVAGLPAMGCTAAPRASAQVVRLRQDQCDSCGSWLAGDGLRRSPKGLSPSCSAPPGPMRFLWELACRRWAAPQPQGPQPKLFASARINAIPVGAGLPAMGCTAAQWPH